MIQRTMKSKLKIGDKAPHFAGIDQDGNIVTLKEFEGKKLIVFFYFRDALFMSISALPMLAFKRHYDAFRKEGYEVIGIGIDSERDHHWMANYLKLPYRIITDSCYAINRNYGTWAKSSKLTDNRCYTVPTIFVLDEKGTIQEIVRKIWMWGRISGLLRRIQQGKLSSKA